MVFKRHKITIFNFTFALSTQSCCDIHVICIKGQERLKKQYISVQSEHYCTYPLYSDSWVELNSTDFA